MFHWRIVNHIVKWTLWYLYCLTFVILIILFCTPNIQVRTWTLLLYWSTNETTENISIPAAVGTYSVTVTDNVGCTATDDVTITDLSQFFYNIEGYNLCEGQQGQLIINWGFWTSIRCYFSMVNWGNHTDSKYFGIWHLYSDVNRPKFRM